MALLCTLLHALSAQEQEDGCPIPVVEIRNQLNGKLYRPPGFLGFEQGNAGEEFVTAVHDMALNKIVEANRHNVRFKENITSNPLDADFILTLDGSATADSTTQGVWHGTSSATLVDRVGRVVVPTRTIHYTTNEPLERVAEQLVPAFRKLLRTIRRHQVEVRQQTNSAIYAELEFDPAEAVIAQGESIELVLTLHDCGPDEQVPLPDREVELDLSGVGDIDRTRVRTDADGKARVRFQSDQNGLAEVTAWWVYDNTEGRRLSAGNVATIRVEALPELKISIAPTQKEGRKYFMGIVEALAEDHIIEYLQVDGGPLRKSDWPPPECINARRWQAGGTRIESGTTKVFEKKAKVGPQQSRIRIEVQQPEFYAATVHALVYAHAEPEQGWEEEDGSNTYSHAVFDLLVDVENPSETDYDLWVRWPQLSYACEGAVEYQIEIFGKGMGCRQGPIRPLTSLASLRYAYYDSEATDLPSPGTRRSTRFRVRGEQQAQFEFRVNMRTEAYGGIMEPPYSGTCPLEL
ncbi:MAG: hypothetical protein D6818_07520, partial [Bacteroidetes bacterium]